MWVEAEQTTPCMQEEAPPSCLQMWTDSQSALTSPAKTQETIVFSQRSKFTTHILLVSSVDLSYHCGRDKRKSLLFVLAKMLQLVNTEKSPTTTTTTTKVKRISLCSTKTRLFHRAVLKSVQSLLSPAELLQRLKSFQPGVEQQP